MSQATEPARAATSASVASTAPIQADWELNYYSRPILEPDGKKRWDLLICSTPELGSEPASSFRWALNCPAASVNSQWLRQALEDTAALDGPQPGPPVPVRDRRDQDPRPFLPAEADG